MTIGGGRDPFHDGYDFVDFPVTIIGEGLQAKSSVRTIEGLSLMRLTAFFDALADDWRGVRGEPTWDAIEHDLSIAVSRDSLGQSLAHQVGCPVGDAADRPNRQTQPRAATREVRNLRCSHGHRSCDHPMPQLTPIAWCRPPSSVGVSLKVTPSAIHSNARSSTFTETASQKEAAADRRSRHGHRRPGNSFRHRSASLQQVPPTLAVVPAPARPSPPGQRPIAPFARPLSRSACRAWSKRR